VCAGTPGRSLRLHALPAVSPLPNMGIAATGRELEKGPTRDKLAHFQCRAYYYRHHHRRRRSHHQIYQAVAFLMIYPLTASHVNFLARLRWYDEFTPYSCYPSRLTPERS